MSIPKVPSMLYECCPGASGTIITKPLLHEQPTKVSELALKRHFELGVSAGIGLQLFALLLNNTAIALLERETLIQFFSLSYLTILVAVLSGAVVVSTLVVLRFVQSSIYSVKEGGNHGGPAWEFFDGAVVGISITLVVANLILLWGSQLACFVTTLLVVALVWYRMPTANFPVIWQQQEEESAVAAQYVAFVV